VPVYYLPGAGFFGSYPWATFNGWWLRRLTARAGPSLFSSQTVYSSQVKKILYQK
jgi:hypothetical protein